MSDNFRILNDLLRDEPDAIPFRALLWLALRGGLALWRVTVAVGFIMAWFHWPIPGTEILYTAAVWAVTIALAPVFLISGLDSMFELWGWLFGTFAWLPVLIAFRFANLVAAHPNKTSPTSPTSLPISNGRNV